jgi:alpha-N-acetylglucosaminidase
MRVSRPFFAILVLTGVTAISHASSSPVEEALGVIRRTAGDRVAAHVHVSLGLGSYQGKDSYSLDAHKGEIKIQATSPVAACRGFYDYLKSACHCQVNWSGENVKLPNRLPACTLMGTSFTQFRHYYNICTFGYTTAFWDWNRWRREIDWMALHGINMPLSVTGQDKVWRATFRAFGVPDSSSMKFFSGPAFQPWHWMGNLNGHMGPPPESWLEGQAELEKKILAAEKGLGMTPVVSGFSGFVPVDFGRYNQKVKLLSPTSWGGFEPTKFVDVRDPMFVEIGKRYIEEYRKEFGDVQYYLCDTFNEQNPQFPAATKLQDLAACGKAVYDSIHAGDPQGIWVMQGWLFYNEQDYWGKPEVGALLSKVPQNRMIILDLATSQFPVWQRQPAVAAKGWIFNTLHNYGQNTELGGELQTFADAEMAVLNSPSPGRFLGMGLTMEGIDQNPVVYEMMTDLMWHGGGYAYPRDNYATSVGLPVGMHYPNGHVMSGDPTFSVSEWLDDYAYSRYGVDRPELRQVWAKVLKTLYSGGIGAAGGQWRKRPTNRFWSDPDQTAGLRDIVSQLYGAGEGIRQNELYQRDLVDLTKTWLGCLADSYATAALASWPDDKASYAKYKAEFLQVLDDIDQVMACRPEHRLTTWLNGARSWGQGKAEKDYFERNARWQITVWDGKDAIEDYAIKEWAGLTKDYNKRRWKLVFDSLESGRTLSKEDQLRWELGWANSSVPPAESQPQDINALIPRLLDRYPDSPNVDQLLNLKPEDPGIAVGKPVTVSGGTEAGTRPEVVVDGKTSREYWAASPPPVWLQVDLEKPCQVSEIDLFCYHGDERYYQYKLDVSLDGKAWTTVVDASKNTELSTYRGYRHKFPAVSARYVRVTMLHNSANIGQHIYELRVK